MDPRLTSTIVGPSKRSAQSTVSDTGPVPLLTCPVIVGREEELAALEARLVTARAGHGGVVVVSGEAGVGKSRLAREIEDRARRAGMVVASGRAVPDAVHVPFRALAEATHSALRDGAPPMTPDLEPFRAVLGPFVPEWAGGEADPGEREVVMLEAIVRLFRAIAGGRGLLVVLEDLHWSDRDTLAAVQYSAGALTASSVCLLCTERTDMAGPAADVTGRLTASRAAQRIELERLGDADVATMARLTLDAQALPSPLLELLRRRAEGLPFLVEELLSGYLSAGGSVEAAAEWRVAGRVAEALPASFRDLLLSRLASLDAAANRCVRAAAVLGRTFDWRLLAPITGLPPDAVFDSLRAAVFEQVLVGSSGADPDAFSFRHALVREAVLADLLLPERAELARIAAEVIEDHRPGLPGEWCERAAELRDQAGDVQGACRLLQESARRALIRGALASAEATLRRARDLAAGDRLLWLGTDSLMSEVLMRAGKTNELVELTKTVVARLEKSLERAPTSYGSLMVGPRMAELHLQVARAAVQALDFPLARQRLAGSRGLAGDDETLHLRIHLVGAALALGEGDSRAALAQAQTGLEAAERSGAGEVVPESLDVIGRALAQSGDLDGATAAFRRLKAEAVARAARVWEVRALGELGAIESLRHGEASALEAARALAIETGAVSALASINLELGWHRLARPSMDEARTFFEEALEAARVFSLPLLADALVARAAYHALRNDPRAVRRAVAEALERAGGRPDIEASALAEGDAVLALLREDRVAGRAALDDAVRAGARWRRGTPWWLGLRILLRAVDDVGEGPDLVGPASTNPIGRACWLYARAVRGGRSGRSAEALRAFADADVAMPEGWKRHLARRLVAEAASEAGWGDPGTWAREALDVFEPLGLATIANACKRVMRQAGTPVPRAGRGTSTVPPFLAGLGVTSREMDVLTFVAQGLSNAEIAARLFLSPRTIEAHVTRLIRKARVATRIQLVAFAARVVSSDAAT
jgi:DNA-binding CsgD family transcriptional regulator/tetratricopeptide (TPR) repeat protein